MKRVPALIVILLLVMASSGFAQRAFQFRVSVPTPTLGFGLEASLQRDLVALIYGDVVFAGPRFQIGGEVLFKPDLGQFDRDLRGIRPYFGGGLGLGLPNTNFALTLEAGIEFALDRDTGLFIGGQSIFPFNSSPSARVLFGASLR